MNNLITIKIGPVTYRVEQVLRLLGSNSDGSSTWLNGRVRYEKALIELEKELPEEVEPIAIVHEIIHAILEQAGINDVPESIVIALGYGLVQVLRDNPELIDLIRPNVSRPVIRKTG
jgi:hypothetical protein